MTTPDNQFATTDINLAAYLAAYNRPLVRVEGPGPWARFVFPREAQADVFEYLADAPVPARRFAQELRRMKRAVYDAGFRQRVAVKAAV